MCVLEKPTLVRFFGFSSRNFQLICVDHIKWLRNFWFLRREQKSKPQRSSSLCAASFCGKKSEITYTSLHQFWCIFSTFGFVVWLKLLVKRVGFQVLFEQRKSLSIF